MITGRAKSTADIDSRAIERSGKLLVKLIGIGVSMSGGTIEGIIVIKFERTTPYKVVIDPMIM